MKLEIYESAWYQCNGCRKIAYLPAGEDFWRCDWMFVGPDEHICDECIQKEPDYDE